ncbi:hypothetical protein EZS27_031211 [termite gut metagenome]|uniref:Porin n=1 Tax=termite gut metagenome TaxID=433724 RepID=A0A5J4QAS7_9ZZZZ
MNKLFTFFIVIGVFIPKIYSQKFVWSANFDTRFDNREYNSDINKSQTLFGAKLTPEIGISREQNHSKLLIGISMIEEFGAKTFEKKPEMLLYYHYNSSPYSVYTGRFSRKAIIGKYANAFFNDSVRFFDANLDGVLLQYRKENGYVELAFDWDSRQSETRREKFMIFSSALRKKQMIYGGYNFSMYHYAMVADGNGVVDNIWDNFSMYHYAMVADGNGVVDNIWVMPFIGIDLSGKTVFDKLSLEAGWLQAFQNDRSNVGKYVKPGGVHIDAQIEKYTFGISNTLFHGDSMMPYYERYGSGLYRGDAFYNTGEGIYNRLELYWKPLQDKNMNFKVSSVHHYDGQRWSWQQVASFSVSIQ